MIKFGSLNPEITGIIAATIEPFEWGSRVLGGGNHSPSGSPRRTRSERRSTLNAAMKSPPVVLKLISRVNDSKSLNNLMHYLNKEDTVELTDEAGKDYNKNQLPELYNEWVSKLESSERKTEEYKTLDTRKYVNYSDESKLIIEKISSSDFDIEKIKPIMQDARKNLKDQLTLVDVPEGYKNHAWNRLVSQVGIKLAKIKNQEKEKNVENPIINKIAQAQRRTQYYKSPEKNIARHGVIAFPEGTPETKTIAITRAALAKQFATDQVDYFTAAHTKEEGENPHVHFVFSTKRPDGKKIDMRKDDIMKFRHTIAAEAEKEGIHLHSGKAWERGVSPTNTPSFVLHKMANERINKNEKIDDKALAAAINKDLENDKITHARKLGIKPTEAEIKFKKHIIKQVEIFQKDADFYNTRYEREGKDKDKKRSDLIEKHIKLLVKSQPERLQLIKNNETNKKDRIIEPGVDR